MKDFAILLVAHGHFAEEALASAQMIMGEQENAAAFGLFPGMGGDNLAAQIQAELDRLTRRNLRNILLLTDVPYGTPCNVSLALAAKDPRLTVISGFNLLLVLGLCNLDRADPKEIEDIITDCRSLMEDVTQKIRGRQSEQTDEEDL